MECPTTLIGRREPGEGGVKAARIPKAVLFQANLRFANLTASTLSNANLFQANLRVTHFRARGSNRHAPADDASGER
jgi:uncharacterized protein YjbI with pentapeptide repeats